MKMNINFDKNVRTVWAFVKYESRESVVVLMGSIVTILK